jgi:hypothetical protein
MFLSTQILSTLYVYSLTAGGNAFNVRQYQLAASSLKFYCHKQPKQFHSEILFKTFHDQNTIWYITPPVHKINPSFHNIKIKISTLVTRQTPATFFMGSLTTTIAWGVYYMQRTYSLIPSILSSYTHA